KAEADQATGEGVLDTSTRRQVRARQAARLRGAELLRGHRTCDLTLGVHRGDLSGIHRIKLLLDDLQRQVIIALVGQDVAQTLNVLRGEAAVARLAPAR